MNEQRLFFSRICYKLCIALPPISVDGIQGQAEPDAEAAVERFGAHGAAVGHHQLLDDGKADTGAAVLAGAGLLTAIEAFEKKGGVFGDNLLGVVG